jgi:carbamoyl-phosphate synthase small subunit
LLVLADGSEFYGRAIGAEGSAVGEVVFNTSMTGYQEILTDPSYARQIVTLTYPHIGNTGTNAEDEECDQIWAAGLVIRDLPLLASSFRNQQPLDDYLRERNVVGIADIDTRRLTRLLRDGGAQSGCIVAGDAVNSKAEREAALAKAKAFAGLKGMDLAKVVSTKQSYPFNEGSWQLGTGYQPAPAAQPYKVVAYDFGVKRNILRLLVDRGCDVTVVPAETPASEALAMSPDGIFLSNGPGDPEPCDYAIAAIREFLDLGIPTYGICLGHQLMGLAVGGHSMKMKFGHHGGNHPVQDLQSGKVMITAQNHGFAVDADSLPDSVEVTHKSLFDGTLQGFRVLDKPAFSFQGHPEASPGPHDLLPLFDQFVEMMKARR